MQKRKDSGLEGYRKRVIQNWRDTGKRGTQDWMDAGKEKSESRLQGYRKGGVGTGGLQDTRDTGLKGSRKGGIQDCRDTGNKGFGTGGI